MGGNKVKRFLALFLVIALSASSFTVFARENDYIGTKYEIPVKVLSAFDIITLNDDGDLDVGSKVSRAEFATWIVKALGFDINAAKDEYEFSDVEKDSKSYNAISIASNLKIISGFNDGTFRPNDAVTYHQAVTMIIKMLGYEVVAMSKGGFPMGYIQIAREIGVLSDVTVNSGELTKADAVLVLYNAMHAKMMKQIGYGSRDKYQADKDSTIFSEYHGVKKQKGIIVDNGETAMNGDTKTSKGYIIIDGQVYRDQNNCLKDYLGYFVEFYYLYEDKDNSIVFGYVPEYKNQVITIDAEDLVKDQNPFADKSFKYYREDEKEESISISKDLDVIFNGRAYPQFTPEELLIDVGELTFVDNNSDGAFDILFVETFKHIVVAGADEDKLRLVSFNNEMFEIDREAEYSFVTTQGEQLNISDLSADMIISLFESPDKKKVKGIVSTQRVSGEIEEITHSDDSELKVGEGFYKVSKSYNDYNANDFTVGTKVTLYLDHKSEIAFITHSTAGISDGYDYGYLINAKEQGGLSDKAEFRIFTRNGEFVNFVGANYVEFNGETYFANSTHKHQKITSRSLLDSPLLVENNEVKPQLIQYKLNSSGEISGIKTAIDNTSSLGFDEDHFSKDYTSASAVYRDIPKMFGSSYVVNNDTLMFNIPAPDKVTGEINEDGCMVISLSKFEGNNVYPVTLYDATSSRIVSVLVTSTFSTEDYSRWGLLVEKKVKAINEEGETVTKVYGYMDGKRTAYEFADDVKSTDDIKPGDMLRVMLNVKNQITGYTHLFDIEETVFPSQMSSNPGGILVNVYGKVLSKDKGAMTVVVDENKVYPFVFSTYTRIYYVDKSNSKKVKVGLATSDDIIQSGKNYENLSIDTMVGSKVYINRRYDNAYDIVIVK